MQSFERHNTKYFSENLVHFVSIKLPGQKWPGSRWLALCIIHHKTPSISKQLVDVMTLDTHTWLRCFGKVRYVRSLLMWLQVHFLNINIQNFNKQFETYRNTHTPQLKRSQWHCNWRQYCYKETKLGFSQ